MDNRANAISEAIGDTNKSNNKGLAGRLTWAFLVCGLIPLFLVATLATFMTYQNTMNEAETRLDSLIDSKRIAIERYGETLVGQIKTLSSSSEVREALLRFGPTFNQSVSDKLLFSSDRERDIQNYKQQLSQYYANEFLPKYQDENPASGLDVNTLMDSLSSEAILLQYGYIQDNPAAPGSKHVMEKSSLNVGYDKVHADVHPSMRSFLETFGFYDIFLVNSETGKVVYSVFKELDFATSLIDGPFANSGLAQVFKEARSLEAQDEYIMTDYQLYTPSYEAPASFIASPVFDRGRQIGVLVFQLPIDAISSIMNSRDGMGETGEAYLVGPDNLLRSDTYKRVNELNVVNSFKNNLAIDTEAVRLGLDGNNQVLQTQNYLSETTITGVTDVEFGTLNWAMVVDIEKSELMAPLFRFGGIVATVLLVVTACLIAFARYLSGSITEPIKSMREAMKEVVENGDFSTRVVVESEDEIGASAHSFNVLLDSIGKTIDEVNQVAGAMANGDFDQRVHSELHGDLDRLKQGINSSATEMRAVMDTMGELICAISRGDFRFRPSRELPGEFASLLDAMQFIDQSINSISSVMSKVSNGDIKSRISAELPGQLGEIKDDVNHSLEAISGVFQDVGRVMGAIAQGNLRETIDAQYSGAFDQLKEDANASIAKLTDIVEQIQQSSQAVRAGAGDIAQGNTHLSDRTERQASSLELTASSMDEITNTVKNTADNAKRANDLAESAQGQAIRGGEVVSRAIAAMEEINTSSSRIAEIISVIDEIAFQTNLLALNASVEAARAGEQGRGFAVVASEVRSLAGRSATAAKEITTLIEDSVSKVEVGSKMVSESGETLDEIVAGVENVTNVVSEIAVAAEEQSMGINEVHRAIAELQTLTQQNTALVEEAAAASNELDDQAMSLNSLTGFFELAQNGLSLNTVGTNLTNQNEENDEGFRAA